MDRRARELQRRERERRLKLRRRRLAGLGIVALGAFAVGATLGAAPEAPEETRASSAPPRPELPRGGRSLLPRYRLVGFYGAPQSDELGALGIGTPAQATARLLEQARAYRGNRPVMPVFELIAVTAASDAGEDGLHRLRQPHSVIRDYLAAARKARGILLLDVQPGRADFAREIARLDRYLREPDVGLALDPEWHVGPDQVPGEVIGSVELETVDAISARLAETVERLDLPEKLFVIHQFTADMISGSGEPAARRGLATVLNVDGFGDPANKAAKYRQLRPPTGSPLFAGFKLFYSEDVGLMGPGDVLALRPKPDLIVYE